MKLNGVQRFGSFLIFYAILVGSFTKSARAVESPRSPFNPYAFVWEVGKIGDYYYVVEINPDTEETRLYLGKELSKKSMKEHKITRFDFFTDGGTSFVSFKGAFGEGYFYLPVGSACSRFVNLIEDPKKAIASLNGTEVPFRRFDLSLDQRPIVSSPNEVLLSELFRITEYPGKKVLSGLYDLPIQRRFEKDVNFFPKRKIRVRDKCKKLIMRAVDSDPTGILWHLVPDKFYH